MNTQDKSDIVEIKNLQGRTFVLFCKFSSAFSAAPQYMGILLWLLFELNSNPQPSELRRLGEKVAHLEDVWQRVSSNATSQSQIDANIVTTIPQIEDYILQSVAERNEAVALVRQIVSAFDKMDPKTQ